MPNRSTDALFQLIHTMEKSEKRNFKLYVTRNTATEDLKIIQVFDALDKMNEYDEELLLKKNPSVKKQQLSNIKAHLYKQLLASLRVLKTTENIQIQLHEQLDYANLLYNKGLYMQSLKMLEKLKETAKEYNQVTFMMQALFLEKNIEVLHITRSMEDRAEVLASEAEQSTRSLSRITQLSNLALKLYSWYIKNGHARNENDAQSIKQYFEESLPFEGEQATGFYEKLYFFQSYSWFGFILQDFLMYYRYTQKWVDLFEREPFMIEIETAHYIKGMHNLISANFDLKNRKKFNEYLEKFERFSETPLVTGNDNNRVQSFVYIHIAKLNKHFMEGTFTEGLQLVPHIEQKIKEYWLYLDRHRILVFYYKISSLYFGSGDYDNTITYLNKIINWKVDLRTDLQCYARLLHLIAHYEIGNFDILEYLIKSVYRFMAKMENLSIVEEEIFKFLRNSFHLSYRKLRPEFEKLLMKLKSIENNRFETRAFAYLDIISWLESKVYEKPLQAIIKEKSGKSFQGSQ
ncbi:MAG: hypothetical protein JWQ09_1423 [Segetibacter sp.]|nr:hypothetical protein [Segetibacter sp.]